MTLPKLKGGLLGQLSRLPSQQTMDKIKLGVIGCGDIAFRSYLPALRELGDQVELILRACRPYSSEAARGL